MRGGRGVALIQALVIVAAIAAVAAALLLRADIARQRLQIRFTADQTALYLESGAALVAAMLDAVPLVQGVHHRQDWARPRTGIVIDRGLLAWEVDDLQGRFNVNTLNGVEPKHLAARAAFLRLAADQGLNRATARRLADALGPDSASLAPGDGVRLPLIDPRQLAPLAAAQPEAFARLLRFLSALPEGMQLNVNTLQPPVLEALLPDMPSAQRSALARHLRGDPAHTLDDFMGWAQANVSPAILEQLSLLPLTTTSTAFVATLDAQLDTLHLRRSVVLIRDPVQQRSIVVLSTPEFE